MVLATKVGRERGFGVGLLLTIVTFGIYAIYWNYKAHNELYRQFELEREGRDEGMVWYVLGLVLQPLLVPYMWVFASNVNYLRSRIGLRHQMTPGKFVAIAGSGIGAIAAGVIILVVATYGLTEESPQSEVDAAVEAGMVPFLTLSILGLVLLAVAYAGLQRDINELWDAYDARVRYLSTHPTELRSPEMAALNPADAAMLAAPLRREVEALRARHADLRALAELDSLVLRAESGDAEARERGETLVADVAALLLERAELLDREDGLERLDVVESALFGDVEARRGEA